MTAAATVTPEQSAQAAHDFRTALAQARRKAADRRAEAARRMAYGLSVAPEVLVDLCLDPEDERRLHAEVARWRSVRAAWAKAKDLPAAEAAHAHATAEADRCRASAQAALDAFGKLPPMREAERDRRRGELRLAVYNAVVPVSVGGRRLAARNAWRQVLELTERQDTAETFALVAAELNALERAVAQ